MARAAVTRTGTLHAATWAWWALMAVVTVQLAPSPTYVALVVVLAALLVELHGDRGPLARAFPVLVAASALFVVVRVVLTALTTHGGGDVLFRLPQLTLPPIAGGFTVGGTVEATVVLRAATDAFVVVGVVAAFAAFNAVVSHHELVRLAPRAFHEVGLVVTVALAFVPATIATVAAVREADRARTGGRIVRRGRWRRLLLPVLESGMERAMRLAESMDARGFAHGGAGAHERRAGWWALVGLLALSASFAALVSVERTLALVLLVAGALALGWAVLLASRGAGRPRYRPSRPTRRDLVVAGVVALAPVSAALLGAHGAELAWHVGAQAWPPFDPVALVPLLLLAVPAVPPLQPTRAVEQEAAP